MREKADSIGVDLLVVDCGDRIEGNGLYDASDPKGKYTYDLFREQHIDVITPGNHELYQLDAAEREFQLTVSNFKENYLASNLDYIKPGTGERVPMAQRYRTFTTKNQGIRVAAFGFIFDFTGNGNNTVVQPVKETIKEEWFQQAIREKVDLFVVAGHVTLPGPEYDALYKAIRSQNWDTPIQFFGGHSHIRNFKKYDAKAYGLQGGRYMETIGWMSIDGIKGKGKVDEVESFEVRASMNFERRYIDNNLFGYYHHTGLNESTFPTEHGSNVSRSIHKAREALNLDHNYGCAPKDLWLTRAKYPSGDSLLTWLENDVLPEIVVNPNRTGVPTLALTNTGAMRFDIFKGAFTRDTTFIISPFVSKFKYIQDVPYKAAKDVLALINNAGPVLQSEELSTTYLAPPEQMSLESDFIAPSPEGPQLYPAAQGQFPLIPTSSGPDLVPGYTTKDDAGDDGDDTIHAPITFYKVPNCIQCELSLPKDEEPEKVDLVFIDFIQPWVLAALKYNGQSYNTSDVESYRPETLTELMALWIRKHWGQDC